MNARIVVRIVFSCAGLAAVVAHVAASSSSARAAEGLTVGFGLCDITPRLDGKRPIWLAGLENNRAAKEIHDHLFARAIVLGDGRRKVALVLGRFDRPAAAVDRAGPRRTA